MTPDPPAGRDAAYFDALYAADPDPWRFETSDYERAKYAASLAALPGRRWRRALEVGCSIGVFTRQLAAHCDDLMAVDYAAAAVAVARARCADLPWVRVAEATIPRDWPDAPYDLIVLSEVLYFLPPDGVVVVAGKVAGALSPDGVALIVNWRGPTGTILSGDDAAALFLANLGPDWRAERQGDDDQYRVDVAMRRRS